MTSLRDAGLVLPEGLVRCASSLVERLGLGDKGGRLPRLMSGDSTNSGLEDGRGTFDSRPPGRAAFDTLSPSPNSARPSPVKMRHFCLQLVIKQGRQALDISRAQVAVITIHSYIPDHCWTRLLGTNVLGQVDRIVVRTEPSWVLFRSVEQRG